MEMVKHLKAVEMEQKRTISELEADILACHSKEAELLAFSEKMTAKNAQLQSEATGNSSKVQVVYAKLFIILCRENLPIAQNCILILFLVWFTNIKHVDVGKKI